MRKIEKLNTRILDGESIWRKLKEFISTLENENYLKGIKAFANKSLKRSKNTAKLYVRLALKSKLDFMSYFCIPKPRKNTYSLELPQMIALRYKKACDERAFLTDNKKTKITFKTFFNDYNQTYYVQNKKYKPKITYVQEAIRFHGLYSQLSTHKTKMSARHKKTKVEQLTLKNEDLIKQMGINEYAQMAKAHVEEIQECAPRINRTYLPGQQVEIDASKERWGKEEWTVYSAIDASTGFKVGEWVDKEETNLGYLKLLTDIFEEYGYPSKIITDKRRGWDGKSVAQIRDMLKNLPIEVISSSNPNAKPKVERSFRTMENDFYYNFLRKHNAWTLKEAQKLVKEARKAYNEEYKKELDYENSLYRHLTPREWSELKITYIFKFKQDQTFNFMGKDYGLFASEGTRVFVRSGIIKITIDYEGKIIYKDLRQNLYAKTDWQNKK